MEDVTIGYITSPHRMLGSYTEFNFACKEHEKNPYSLIVVLIILLTLLRYCVNHRIVSLQIRTIDRKQEVPHDGPMCDLLWSDPEGNCLLKI